jgi:hypothetical protein
MELGRLHEQRGAVATACACYEECLLRIPDNESIQLALARLLRLHAQRLDDLQRVEGLLKGSSHDTLQELALFLSRSNLSRARSLSSR